MVNDPITPATIARADERRRLAGIPDESLVDHIIDVLVDERTALWDKVSQKYSLDEHDLHRLVTLTATETLTRASVDVMVKGTPQSRGRKDFVHGLYEASQIVNEVRL